jgi:hypothetical protein
MSMKFDILLAALSATEARFFENKPIFLKNDLTAIPDAVCAPSLINTLCVTLN